MDDALKRKFFDLEINPPEKMWEKISAALDEEVAAEFPSQLYELELQPPLKSWSAISTTLSYSEKLYNLELQPPVDTWQKISSLLDEEKPVRRIIPIRRIALWKYVAAASLFAFIGFGVKWLTADTVGPEVASQPLQNKTELHKGKKDEQPNAQATVSTEEKQQDEIKLTNNLPKEGPRQEVPEIAIAKSTNYKRQGNFVTAVHKIQKPVFASPDAFCMTNLQTCAPGYEPRVPESAYRYLIFENDNCDWVRMSKKLAEKLGCNIPDPNDPNYQNCIQQLKKWSEKIAQLNITPSADNFMNIFELLKSTEQ